MRTTSLVLALACVVSFPAQIVAQEPREAFTRLALARGLTIELPANWVVLSENARITVRAFGEAVGGPQDLPSDLQFAANLYDDAGATLALMNVRYYPEMDLTQEDARAAGAAEVRDLDAALKESMETGLSNAGMQITAWHGTSTTTIAGLTAFVTEYERASLIGRQDFRARLVRVFAGDQSFTLTVSYASALGPVLRPITDRIINSLQLAGYAAEQPDLSAQWQAQQGAQTGERDSPLSLLYGEAWGLVLAVSLVLTWGIGLTPPLLIRHVGLKRPLGRAAALSIVVGLWILNVLIFTALGSRSHTALTLVGFVSYWILRREGRPEPPAEVTARKA